MKQNYKLNLRLREQHSDLFESVCLYSDVSCLLASYSFSVATRRFVQDLFMDVDFSDVGPVLDFIVGYIGHW